MQLKNGDVYNIGQTINGIQNFLYLGDTWFYYSKDLNREYEYDQVELTQLVRENEFGEVTLVGNIFNALCPILNKDEKEKNNQD